MSRPTRDDLERWVKTRLIFPDEALEVARLALDLLDELSRHAGVRLDGVVGQGRGDAMTDRRQLPSRLPSREMLERLSAENPSGLVGDLARWKLDQMDGETNVTAIREARQMGHDEGVEAERQRINDFLGRLGLPALGSLSIEDPTPEDEAFIAALRDKR